MLLSDFSIPQWISFDFVDAVWNYERQGINKIYIFKNPSIIYECCFPSLFIVFLLNGKRTFFFEYIYSPSKLFLPNHPHNEKNK